MVVLSASCPAVHPGCNRTSEGAMMGYIKVVSLRRWNWLPWFKKNHYVPVVDSIDVGQRVSMFDSYDEALLFLVIMEKVK